MKKICVSLFLLVLSFMSFNVFAEEYFYVNNNGLSFTEFQYNILSDMIGEESIINMTSEEYMALKVANMEEGKINYVIQDINPAPGISTYGATHETASKIMSIYVICQGMKCEVISTTTWKANPKVRSYDAYGFRFSGTKRADTFSFLLSGDNSGGYDDIKYFSNGMGIVKKLPKGNINYLALYGYVDVGGTVYASYQHATKSISKSTALNFTISSTGYGGVLKYPTSYSDRFDRMQGVSIKVA